MSVSRDVQANLERLRDGKAVFIGREDVDRRRSRITNHLPTGSYRTIRDDDGDAWIEMKPVWCDACGCNILQSCVCAKDCQEHK